MDDFCNSLTSPVAASGVCVVEPINGWMDGWMKPKTKSHGWMCYFSTDKAGGG